MALCVRRIRNCSKRIVFNGTISTTNGTDAAKKMLRVPLYLPLQLRPSPRRHGDVVGSAVVGAGAVVHALHRGHDVRLLRQQDRGRTRQETRSHQVGFLTFYRMTLSITHLGSVNVFPKVGTSVYFLPGLNGSCNPAN